MSSKKDKPSPLEAGLVEAAKALDNQIARQMQRSPEETEAGGVQKWEPHSEKVEQVASLLVEQFGLEEIGLDSLIVLTQGFAKALYILSSELGEEGLGELRSKYCSDAFTTIIRDAQRGIDILEENTASLH